MLKELLEKSNLANFVAATALLAGLIFAFHTQDKDILLFVVGPSIGFLLGKSTAK